MRKIELIAVILLFITHSISAKNEHKISAKVDERIELLSVVCRLAEFKEYVNKNIPSYAKDVDTYFAEYKSHELITLAKKLNKERGISYDAIASIATSIEISKGIKLKNDLLPKGIDKRWNQESIEIFIDHLNSFYKATNFIEFYNSHKDLYLSTERRFNKILEGINFSWLESFYGTVLNADFHLMLGMLNGYGNYGVTSFFKGDKEEINAIIGINEIDSVGNPIFLKKEIIIPTVVHEFSHSYCNRLVDAYYGEMDAKAQEFYKASEDYLSYPNAHSMLYEILVRACVIKYFDTNTKETNIKDLLNKEKGKGFIWIQELFDALSVYESERKKYPTLYDFMPQIVSVQNNLKVPEIKANFEQALANIESVSITNGDKEVDYKIDHIVIKFDRNIIESAENPVFYSEGDTEDFKPFKQSAYSLDNTQMEWIAPIELKPNTKYTIVIPKNVIVTEDYFPLSEMYLINFKTREEVVSANLKRLPITKNDWMSFDNYNFSGNSSGNTFKGDMYFKRNGVEIDIKTDTVIFMKDAYFKTNSSLIKLEQNKLIISTAEELTNLKYEATEVVETENKICLTGSASIKFPNKSTFKANEIIIEKE